MKIITDGNIFSEPHKPSISNKPGKGSNFEDILNASINKASSPPVSSDNANITAMENFPKLSLVQSNRPQTLNRDQLVDKIDHFLNLLEDYAAKLEDANVDMHELHPLVSNIKKENQYLKTQLPQLDIDDHLALILKSTLDAAEKELHNFETGCYVSIEK